MHVAKVEKKQGDRVYVSWLIRQSYREDGKVRHRTLANISALPPATIDLIRRSLRGESLGPLSSGGPFRVVRSKPNGHVEAVLGAVDSLEIAKLLGRDDSRQRRLVLAMVAQRILDPASKLGSTRLFGATSLADRLALGEVRAAELYEALDWLLGRKARVEQALARRHLTEGGTVLYDVSSSWYEGETCELAKFGHDRDGRAGRRIIVYGLLADAAGRPVSIDVYPGNTGDPATVPDQVERLRERFALERVVLVGDRGMLTSARIRVLRERPGVGWISALRSQQIRQLMNDGAVCAGLFDETDLAEIRSPDFPGERLVVCYNPVLADRRRRKREELLAATESKLVKLQTSVARRTKTPLSDAEIGRRLGAVQNRHRVAKHFAFEIGGGRLAWRRNEESIAAEARLDGIYVIRTSEPTEGLAADDAVRTYKSLAQVERAFRCMKGLDLLVRPIHHRLTPRVEAHFLLCMLAYYVEHRLREAWAPLTFAEDDLPQARATRDPVRQAEASEGAKEKKATKRTAAGLPAHSFRTLLRHLATRTLNTCEVGEGGEAARFEQVTPPDEIQQEAFRLLGIPL